MYQPVIKENSIIFDVYRLGEALFKSFEIYTQEFIVTLDRVKSLKESIINQKKYDYFLNNAAFDYIKLNKNYMNSDMGNVSELYQNFKVNIKNIQETISIHSQPEIYDLCQGYLSIAADRYRAFKYSCSLIQVQSNALLSLLQEAFL